MDASLIDKERFGGNFEDSRKILAGDVIEVTGFQKFTAKEGGYDGVSLSLKDGTKAHTTAKQPVGYITSEKLDLQGLISRSEDGAVTLYFYSDKPNTNRTEMLKCSIYKPRS